MISPKVESLLTQAAREARKLYPNVVAREGNNWLYTLILADDMLMAEETEAEQPFELIPPPSTTPLDRYAVKRNAMAKMMEDVRAEARGVFLEAMNELFTRYAGLNSVRWTQYTDYFNDGSTCTFSAHVWDFKLNVWEIGYEEWDFYLRNLDNYPLQPTGGFETLDQEAEAAKDVAQFLQSFDQEDYEEIFGDHVHVEIDRSGIHISEYTHHD